MENRNGNRNGQSSHTCIILSKGPAPTRSTWSLGQHHQLWGDTLLPSELINWKWLVYKWESYVIRVWETFSFASQFPPFPIKRSSVCPATECNRCHLDGAGDWRCTIRADRRSLGLTAPSADQSLIETPARRELTGRRTSLTNTPSIHRGMVVSTQREASWFSLPSHYLPPIHLDTFGYPVCTDWTLFTQQLLLASRVL